MDSMTDDYLRAYIAYMELYHPTLWADSKCVKEIFYPDYAKARERIPYIEVIDNDEFSFYLFLGVGGGCVLILIIISVLIYAKRKATRSTVDKEEDEDDEET
jgi:hypothetical protein